ncbi:MULTISPECIES: hypothetical protein [unclassified Methylobacterium]|uniref:hypothetical protein n=1 Tax=unclassified Methylobacterium TaxID=2615210 RepID=UPI0011C1DBD0|nr:MULTISPECIES: hypothetical protein [unclassified Methylobacterium]QEE41767.1 hypothetical protein FVA80_25335 [Methylobacterium sp. WL1]TXN00697.1 hypothetical protein FV242_21225 [Methylobacterium sp. WL64]TXN56109.1 hypothetical protein FV241_17075 [Methylobacterium sp. WL2]
MRTIFAAALLVCCATAASAGEPLLDGPVAAGGFGMSGSDYYGDIRSRMPFTREGPPRPVGVADLERARAARMRAATASRRVEARSSARRRTPHG